MKADTICLRCHQHCHLTAEVIGGKIVSVEDASSEKRMPTCTEACPLGMDVPGYIIAVSQRKFKEATEIIRDTNPLDTLKELTIILPDHTWLTYFRKKGEEIELGGISKSAISLISILESSALFRDVSFSSPVVKGRGGEETFRIRLYLE